MLGYTHWAEIRDCDAYDARVTVTPAKAGGSMVSRTATVRALAGRPGAICDGTKAVFEAGIVALAQLSMPVKATAPQPTPTVPVGPVILDDLPRLALSVTPDPGDGRLCLFLHGIGGGRSNWLDQLQAMGSRVRAAALDLRGYGDSTLGPGQTAGDDYGADILRVVEKLGAARPVLVLVLVLVGLSHGSWIATSFVMRRPEMRGALVLSGSCTGMSEAGPDERKAFCA